MPVRFLKNRLKTNSLFWKYRHFFQRSIWHDYYNTHSSTRRAFYPKHISKKKMEAIFEFGCASGPNLKCIQANVPYDVKCFGFDINKAAIDVAASMFPSTNFHFTSTLSGLEIEATLSNWGHSSFDLSIFDRVLYLLSERQVENHFSVFGKYYSSVIIDDFHNSAFVDSNGAYVTKNYEALLSKYEFSLVEMQSSDHVMIDKFFASNAKRMIFSKM